LRTPSAPAGGVFYVGDQTLGAFIHRAAHIKIDNPVSGGEYDYSQLTTIHVGGCFFHLISAPAYALPDASVFSNVIKMTQIWPAAIIPPKRPPVTFDPGTYWVAFKFYVDTFGDSFDPHHELFDRSPFPPRFVRTMHGRPPTKG
jgi:hypothetical protein